MGANKANNLARIELIVLVAWLGKDFAWVLLVAPLAWPAALAAICLEAHRVLLEWTSSSRALRVHSLAALAWLSGNATWMSAELLFDTKSGLNQARQPIFPWHSGPIAGAHNEAYYKMGVTWARAQFGCGLALLLLYYAAYFHGDSRASPASPSPAQSSNPQDEDASVEDLHDTVKEAPLAFGVVTPAVYTSAFIGPWIAKDLFWTYQLIVPALAFGVLTLALACDAYRRFRLTTSGVEMLWICGNMFWIYGELGAAALWPRIACAAVLAAGCIIAVAALRKVEDSERAPLMGT